jgi:SAM-dependent methyltransferase
MADLAIKAKIKSKLKAKLKKIANRLERVPVIASFIRINKALRRLPDIVAMTDRLSHHDNFMQSVPVALRGMTRDYNTLQNQVRDLQTKLDSIQHQIWEIPPRFDTMQHQIWEISPRFDAMQHQIWETQAQLRGMVDGFAYVPKRLEFVRSELMFEMRYGASSRLPGSHPAAQSESVTIEILSPEKLERHRVQGLRLNLGCGHIALPDYLNVDSRALPGVDIVADVSSVPFATSEVSEIFSSHVLEHFPQEQLRRQLLPYWASLLKPGGVFVAIVPDADAMIQDYAKGDYLYNNLREVFFGAQDYDGDFHFNMFIPDQMKELFLEAGLSNFEVTVRGRKNGACLEMEVRGYKE